MTQSLFYCIVLSQLHFFFLGFHVGYRCELTAATVKVVTGAGGAEVDVALQIVGEETQTAFQGHHARANGRGNGDRLVFCQAAWQCRLALL